MAVYSSGTYTYVVVNATTGTCGTCSSTLQPHPSFGSMTGATDTIVQLNAVTLGGFNGLNS
jgi:hypothetical protein